VEPLLLTDGSTGTAQGQLYRLIF